MPEHIASASSCLLYTSVQDNAQLILGNHEAMLLACDFVFEEITEHSIARLSPEKWNALQLYLRNGGEATLEAMQKLLQSDPSAAAGILEYLQSAPLYETCLLYTSKPST